MIPARYVNRRLGLFDGAVTALCIAVTAVTYLLYVFQNDLLMNASQASDVLAGFEMFRQKTIFLSDWLYSTEVFTLRSPLFVGLFAFFTDSMILAHRFSVILEICLEILALIYMLRRLDLVGRPCLLSLAIFFGVRSYQSGMLCGMGFSQDATFYVILFLIVGYCAALSSGISSKPEKVLKFVIPTASFMFGLSSIVLFPLMYFPILILSAVRAASTSSRSGYTAISNDVKVRQDIAGDDDVCQLNENFESGQKIFRNLLLWNVMFLLGYLTLSFGVSSRGLGPTLLGAGPSAGFREAVTESLPVLASQFVDWTPLFFIKGATVIRSWSFVAGWSFLFFTLYAAWMTPGAVRRGKGTASDATRAIALCLASALVLMTVQLDKSLVSVRYLSFIYVFAAVLLPTLYRDIEPVNGGLARLLLVCIAFTVVTNGMNNIVWAGRQIEMGQSRATSKHAETIFQILDEHGVSRVYALYWDSYHIEVLSGGRIKVGAVDGHMRPYMTNSSLLKYSEDTAGERTAFVYSINKRNWAPESLNLVDSSLLLTAETTVRIDDPVNPVIVCIFASNPFTFDAAAERAFLASPEDGGVSFGGFWSPEDSHTANDRSLSDQGDSSRIHSSGDTPSGIKDAESGISSAVSEESPVKSDTPSDCDTSQNLGDNLDTSAEIAVTGRTGPENSSILNK
jgi:hypothetical protein